MKTTSLLKPFISCTLLLLTSLNVLANQTNSIVCPTGDELKKINLFSNFTAMPFSFDHESQRAQYIVGGEEDSDWQRPGVWSFFSSSFFLSPSENVVSSFKQSLEQMVPVSATPFNYEISMDSENGEYHFSDPVCIYTIPGNSTFSAMLTFINFDSDESNDNDDDAVKKQRRKAHHQKRMAQIAHHLSLKHSILMTTPKKP